MKNFILTFAALILFSFLNAQTTKENPEKKSKEISKKEEITFQFTFKNTSMKSIPLFIPGVMNPNLSPNSSSGIGLRIGQEVFFKKNGKKYLLLKVNEKNYENEVIIINELIKKRIKELNL
jgi:hypothetical protein